jgi:FkbM family methyltransferase
LINRISKKNTNKHLIFGGAFIGDMAMPISQNYKNTKIDKKIHCFEIDKSPLKLLKMNVSKNRIKNINIVQLALHNLDNVYLDYEIKFDGLTKLTQKK